MASNLAAVVFLPFFWTGGLMKDQQRIGRKVKMRWDGYKNHWLSRQCLKFNIFSEYVAQYFAVVQFQIKSIWTRYII